MHWPNFTNGTPQEFPSRNFGARRNALAFTASARWTNLRLRRRKLEFTMKTNSQVLVGKTPIKFNIPEADAVERLVDLIKEHNKWVEPEAKEAVVH